MSYIYAALILQAMRKEINEANLKKILSSMNAPANGTEIEALQTLMANHPAPRGAEIGAEFSLAPELKRLVSQIEAISTRVTAIEERIAGMESPLAEVLKTEPAALAAAASPVEVSEAEPSEVELAAPSEVEAIGEARYLYCVADGGEEISLGRIGIEGNEVYTIPYKDLSAVVHNCPAEPYKSEDNELVKSWVMAHQKVVEAAQERFGTVLPLGFDTIIKGEEDTDPVKNMKDWLKDDYQNLREKVDKIRGKDEYGVQIFWDPKVIAERITRTNEEISKLDQEMRSKPKGTAYMYKQKLEKALKEEMEALADQYFKDFYNRIKLRCDDVRVGKTKRAEEDKQMLMNLSCLVYKDKYEELGEELEGIIGMEGISVRFTGPWPPYTFVASG